MAVSNFHINQTIITTVHSRGIRTPLACRPVVNAISPRTSEFRIKFPSSVCIVLFELEIVKSRPRTVAGS